MNRVLRFCLLLPAAAMSLGGCVGQDKYDNLEMTNQTSAARLEALNQENRTLADSLNVKQRRIDELEGEVGQLRSINSDLTGQIGGVRSRADQIAGDLANLRLTALDPETDAALQALAEQYPDLIRYDAARGMLQFMSDLTFDSGQATVKAQARQGLQRLAQILSGSSAANYDIRLVGHTDNQQPTRSAARFPTNRHLSVARSIAVEEVLRQSGVPGGRMETSGWGEYRPVVANNPRGGTAQNRRVEIYITAGTGGAMTMEPSLPVSAPAAESAPRSAPSRPAELPMK